MLFPRPFPPGNPGRSTCAVISIPTLVTLVSWYGVNKCKKSQKLGSEAWHPVLSCLLWLLSGSCSAPAAARWIVRHQHPHNLLHLPTESWYENRHIPEDWWEYQGNCYAGTRISSSLQLQNAGGWSSLMGKKNKKQQTFNDKVCFDITLTLLQKTY